MNILIIPSWYPSKNNPINGSFFREQAIALRRAGHSVTVINVTFMDRTGYFDSYNFRIIKEIDEGVLIYSYVTPAFGISKFKGLIYKIFLKKLIKVYQEVIKNGEKFDLIHAHSFMPAGYCATQLGQMYNIPTIVTEHLSSIINGNLSEFHASYLKNTIEESNNFICVGEGLKHSIINLTGTLKELEVVPNIVSPLFKFKDKDKMAIDQPEFVFSSVGFLNSRKRYGLTIKAFAKAFYNNKNIKLKIIGDGNLFKELKGQINDLQMNDQIFLLGKMLREDVVTHIQESDAFVLASESETFGVVYTEALSCGKPVIGTRNGGAEWIINKNNGILIEKDNEKQLIEAMKKMVSSYKDFNRNEISRATIESYSENTVVNKLNVIYERCIY